LVDRRNIPLVLRFAGGRENFDVRRRDGISGQVIGGNGNAGRASK